MDLLSDSMVKSTRLPNGLRVLTDRMPHVRSASIGIWVEAGSRDEPETLNGVSHFIEHAIFKGTGRRNARQIAVESDRQGGQINAATCQESTAFYTQVLDDHLPEAIDLLADLLSSPTFPAEEIERERHVVLEEIKMVEDTPDELVHDLFAAQFWPDHPFGRPVAGSAATVASFTPTSIARYHREHYVPARMLVAAAGNIEHEQVVELIDRHLGNMAAGARCDAAAPPATAPGFAVHTRENLEQAHIIVGFPSPPVGSPDRYAVSLMGAILGDGMSSRLFQRVREERGLAYTISASVEAFLETGLASVYAGVSPENVAEVLALVFEEINLLKRGGPTADELRCAKEQFKVSTVLSLESTFNRMSRLARHQLNFGRQVPVEEVLDAIERVDADQIVEIANRVFVADASSIAILGDLTDLGMDRSALVC
jgi:predicted Zn-dependent peptidase